MSTQGTIKRYIRIIDKISHSHFPSLQTMLSFLKDEGFTISERTLQRNIEAIRAEFGLEIKYNHNRRGYYIDKDGNEQLESFLKFLEIAGMAEVIGDSLKADHSTLNYLSFESNASLKGISHLSTLLHAIKNNCVVSFDKENYKTEKTSQYHVHPYLLKEYQNRWYLVAFVPDLKALRIFGIDRIEGLKTLKEKFKKDHSLKTNERFDNVIGINYKDGKTEEVQISLSPLQAKYIKSLPLHPSQQLLRDDAKESIISLKLIPNYELIQRILMLGSKAKVLKPQWLADEILVILKESVKNYEGK
jgi:predicted DNA-binding transcriptional regulator YafY